MAASLDFVGEDRIRLIGSLLFCFSSASFMLTLEPSPYKMQKGMAVRQMMVQ